MAPLMPSAADYPLASLVPEFQFAILKLLLTFEPPGNPSFYVILNGLIDLKFTIVVYTDFDLFVVSIT